MQKNSIIIILAILLGISIFLNGWLAHNANSIKNIPVNTNNNSNWML